MKTLSESLMEQTNKQPVNESLILAGLACSALISCIVTPIFREAGIFKFIDNALNGGNSGGGGGDNNNNSSKSGGSNTLVSGGGSNNNNNNNNGGGNNNNNNGGGNNNNNNGGGNNDNNNNGGGANSKDFNTLLMLAKQSNENEKNAEAKKKNAAMMDLLAACSYDKDGNEIPMDQRLEKMKEFAGDDFETFKKDMEAEYDKVKDDPKFKESLKKAADSVKAGDYEKFVEDQKAVAKKTIGEIEENKKKIEETEKQLAEIEERAKNNNNNDDNNNGGGLKEKIQGIKDKLTELKNNSIIGRATGGGSSQTTTGTPDPDPKDPNSTGGGEPKPDPDPKDPNSTGGGEPKPDPKPDPKDEEQDVDDSDVEGGLSDDDNEEIKKASAKGAEKPKEPRKVKKRPLERGEGSCYYYEDDPEKKSIGQEGKEAIKAYVKYKKALAEWKKNNAEPKNESLVSRLRLVFG